MNCLPVGMDCLPVGMNCLPVGMDCLPGGMGYDIQNFHCIPELIVHCYFL